MSAASHFTLADEQNGYEQTRKALAAYTPEQLEREYHEYQKASFDRMFGHNPRVLFNMICDELISRGIAELPNIFGPIQVKRYMA